MILEHCLRHLEKQTIANQLEVIVVSDGPDPDTAKLFESPTTYNLPPITYLEIPKSQQGIARNRGVKEATALITLFIGDDIFLLPDACEKHLKTHQKNHESRITNHEIQDSRFKIQNSFAVLGFTTWDPVIEITPIMYWLEQTGWQFGYPLLKNFQHTFIPKNHQHRFTYTSHISLPTDIAKKISFREDMSLYGWEDIEWGLRLRDADVKLFYESDAKALHHHHVTLEDSLRRMETIGRSLAAMKNIDPDFDRIPRGWKLLAYRLLALLPTMRGIHYKSLLKGLNVQK